MGVEGLAAFARGHCEESFGYPMVNPDIDPDFDYQYFVFDGTSYLWNYMRGNLLMDYGYFVNHARQMVTRLLRCGIKLIVFIDANITKDKIETWMSRRCERIEMLFSINNALKKGKGRIFKDYNLWFAVW